MAMAVIETKFSIGDIVFRAGHTTARKKRDCPDCLGTRKWKATSPANTEYEFACPRCSATYQNHRAISLDYNVFAPLVERLTIGQVRTETGEETKYMCRETGIGSGTLHSESKLFTNEADALAAAELECARLNVEVPWAAEQFQKTLSISDYQLDNAVLKATKDADIHRRVLLDNLFDDLRSCTDLDDYARVLKDWDDGKYTGAA